MCPSDLFPFTFEVACPLGASYTVALYLGQGHLLSLRILCGSQDQNNNIGTEMQFSDKSSLLSMPIIQMVTLSFRKYFHFWVALI